jgi:hypothetical protein
MVIKPTVSSVGIVFDDLELYALGADGIVDGMAGSSLRTNSARGSDDHSSWHERDGVGM